MIFSCIGQAPWGCLEEVVSCLKQPLTRSKESHLHAFRRRGTESQWLSHLPRSAWIKFSAFAPQVQNGTSREHCSEPVDGFPSLCGQGQLDRALDALVRMDHEGVVPSVEMYRSLLKACAKKKSLVQTRRAHAHLARHGLESAKSLGEDLVSTFMRCGSPEEALQVFLRLPHRTAYCWAAIISGYTNAGRYQKALAMYQLMLEEDVQPNAFTLVSLLKSCGNIGDLQEGKRIHAEAFRHGLESDLFVGTCLVDMYRKCGSIVDAQTVFDGLFERDVVSWTAMITAYVDQDRSEEAEYLYERMLHEGVSPNDRTFVSVLQACGMLAEKEDIMPGELSTKVHCLQKGHALHAAAWRNGYCSDEFVVSSLVSMYGRCGSIAAAQNAFEALPLPDVVTWNAMLTACVEHTDPEKALQVYEKMYGVGVSPDNRTFVTTLQACGMVAGKEENVLFEDRSIKAQSLQIGKALHGGICRKGYDRHIFVNNTLVSMYGKCGSMVDAQNVFDHMSKQDVVSWNAMLAAYVENSGAEQALQLYEQMCNEGVNPDAWTFVSTLQACGMVAEKHAREPGDCIMVECLKKGEAIHADAQRKGYGSDIFINNTLVSMYGKCRSVTHAQRLFDGLVQREVVSWNAMLSVYVEQEQAREALQLYEEMLQESVSPYSRTFVSVLQACGMLAEEEEAQILDGHSTNIQALGKVKVMHAYMQRKGHSSDVFVNSTLISVYGKCGSISEAQNAFDWLPQLTVVSWNAMMTVFVENGQAESALLLYDRIQEQGLSPDAWTFVITLQACGILAEGDREGAMVNGKLTKVKCLGKGKALHSEVHRRGYDADSFVASTLVSMFGKCWSTGDASNVFDGLSPCYVVSWNAMLTTYVEQDQADEALKLYMQMQDEGMSPDHCTFVSILQVCGLLADEEDHVMVDGQPAKVTSVVKGKVIHADICKRGYDSDIVICNTLISMYGKCGSIADARYLFNWLSERSMASWNAMIAAYGELGKTEQALELYRQMQQDGVSPNEITLVSILHTCGNTGSLDSLRQIHQSLFFRGTNPGTLLSNALVSAYGRCGNLTDAQNAFDALAKPDVVSWNGLIAAYARQGECTRSMQCFEEMRLAGMNPDGATFLALLSACSHAGLVDEGAEYFEVMSRQYGITPKVEHYVCMVDLFGRAGCFSRVGELLSTMSVPSNLAMWLCLMGACQKHGEVGLAQQAFDCAVRLHSQNSAAYVLMSNIYADAGLLSHANALRTLQRQESAWKVPGQSWIEHRQMVHTFSADDIKLPDEHKQVYDLLHNAGFEWKKRVPHSPLDRHNQLYGEVVS